MLKATLMTSPSPQTLLFSSIFHIRKRHHRLHICANHKCRCHFGKFLFFHSDCIQSTLMPSPKYLPKSTYLFSFPLLPLCSLQFVLLYCSQIDHSKSESGHILLSPNTLLFLVKDPNPYTHSPMHYAPRCYAPATIISSLDSSEVYLLLPALHR